MKGGKGRAALRVAAEGGTILVRLMGVPQLPSEKELNKGKGER